ncbi:MAG TPA: M56 family metallopeptidase [Blastocatellia bacterium]|jgi:beta-lactamase regulating signal transducer with metallopeptidase domain
MRTISQLLLTFLLNACWQTALVTAVAALCAWLLRGTTARYQHLLWVTALTFSFGLPALTCSRLPGGAFSSEPPRATVQPAGGAFAPSPQPIPNTQASSPTALKAAAPLILINGNVADVVIVLYLLFLCCRGGGLLMAWTRARSLKRGARLIDLPEHVRTIVMGSQTALGVRHVRILCSTSVPAPIAAGSFNPLIILPEGLLLETDQGVLTAAVGHELAHVLRRDYLLNLIYELVSLPISFHPATALVKRRMRETRELRCDELVTEKLLDATVYARSLVHLAGLAVNLRRPGATITVGIADADILEERVMTILRRPKINTRRRNLLLVAATFLFLAPCVAAAPFALRINITRRSAAETRRETIVIRQPAVVTDQQGAVQEAKQEEREREEQKLRELRAVELKRKAESEALLREGRQLQDASSAQELEEKKKLREAEEKLRAELEAKERDPELMAHRKLEREMMARRQAELAKKANITMQQAIQIAMSQQTGTVMECRLIGELDQVLYILTVVSGDEPAGPSTHMLISAVDGRVVKTWKDER